MSISGPASPPRRPTPVGAPTQSVKSREVKPRKVGKLCPKMVFYAIPGWGKTSLAAHAEDPIVFMSRGEMGYDTLLRAGRVPAVPAELIEDWDDLLSWLDALAANPQGRKTIVLDALGGFERLCHEKVCKRDFKNDWSDGGFMSYHKGYDRAVGEWNNLLQRLEAIRQKHEVTTILLAHSRIRTFDNPMGAKFDRYECDVHPKAWATISRWADDILFAKFETIIDREKQGKGKGIGGTERIIYGEHRDAFDAKSQHGFPAEHRVTSDAAGMWNEIMGLIKQEN